MHRYLGQQKNHYDEIEGGMISKRDEKAVPNAVITRENRISKIILDSSERTCKEPASEYDN